MYQRCQKTDFDGVTKLRHYDCMQQSRLPMSLMSNGSGRSKVRMAMKDMKERFTVTELYALRSDLIQGGMVDSREAAELLQVFLMGRGYGVSQSAAIDAAGRAEMAGGCLPGVGAAVGGRAVGTGGF